IKSPNRKLTNIPCKRKPTYRQEEEESSGPTYRVQKNRQIETSPMYCVKEETEQIPGALEFTLEFVEYMLKDKGKLDDRDKRSPVPVDSPCISIPVVPSNLESNKLEPKEEVKNEKSNIKASLEEVLTAYNTLSWKVNREKEIKPYTSAALEPKDLGEHIGVKKDERLGIEKDERVRIEKVESYLMDSVLVEGLEGYSNSDDNVDTKRHQFAQAFAILEDAL
ncbi:17652_t:CDS:2, partial [Cetraspora pellucida]